MRRQARLVLGASACLGLSLVSGVDRSAADRPVASSLPSLGGKVRAKTVATLRRGQSLGNRANVFAKVGDSLSQSAAFAQGLGCGRWKPGAHRKVRRTVGLFAARPLPGTSTYCHRVNSFSRDSAATQAGQIAGWALERGASEDSACGAREAPLVCEIRVIRPAYAVILFGTNDIAFARALGVDPLPGFISSMKRIIVLARSRGVVPILSTIPPRPDDPISEGMVERLNTALAGLAAQREVPLIDLWQAISPLPNRGISADGLHLSVYGGPRCIRVCDPNTCAPACQPASFTQAGLQYGYNVRNLITVTALGRLSSLQRSIRSKG